MYTSQCSDYTYFSRYCYRWSFMNHRFIPSLTSSTTRIQAVRYAAQNISENDNSECNK